jgi:fluoride exporter
MAAAGAGADELLAAWQAPPGGSAGVRVRVRQEAPVVAVIAAGGVTGALARYGLVRAWPAPAGGFPWATFAINMLGCLLIGVLIVMVSEVWAAHRLIRPFLGTGLLGGFTTFSGYAEQTRALLAAGRLAVASGYLAGTVGAALVAVQLGVVATRWAARPGREPR